MINRETLIKNFRIEQIGSISSESSSEEVFQNTVLRPILKIQNDLLIAIFIDYCIKQKKVFFNLTPDKKLDYIEDNIQRDLKFREYLKGTIIGFFSLDQYKFYNQNASNLNKRLISMLIERLKSQVLLIQID